MAGFEDAVEIGRGGFGVVYRCTQVALDRTVAVKVLTDSLDADNQARFVREQQVMGRLTGHPNIVTVLEAGTTAQGLPFLVMPYHRWDSLHTWLRRNGPLALEKVLVLGVKIAGALESAHRLGVVHRDVKPGNILLTDYGEPALTDFGIAHVGVGFQTSEGTLAGSPAFTAPEVLQGGTPTPAADVYGLGATLFCALTGHAAFERRSGENLATQFGRITTQPVPDLREDGIADDVAAVVEKAMSREPDQRPSVAALGEALREFQQRHGFSASEMALKSPVPDWRPKPTATGRGGAGNLPLELTTFVGRRSEMAEIKSLLSSSRLVTLTGLGGVGKTRLALRAAAQARRDFGDGVWLVELAEVSGASLLVEVVASTLGVGNESARPMLEVLAEFLGSREVLLVLDNCEQVVDAVAHMTETLLQTCPGLRVLVTSREPLNIAGEAVMRVQPLTVPNPDRQPTLLGMPRFDSVALFAERAATVVPEFEVNEDNKAAVTRICTRLDGLPLAIELAAARMGAMSPEQILQRLDDRYSLLTRGSRTAPTRQQTLRWSIDWSYELCTPAEQRLWARLSVFAGGFELDAVEQLCGVDLSPRSVVDVLTCLVDKSILAREDAQGVVRFRMLETVRDYGWDKLRHSGEDTKLRRRHRDWCQRLALDAEAEWVSGKQLDWIARLDREQPNLREALEFCLSEDTEDAAEAGLRIAAALYEYWIFRLFVGEGRSWIDRVLARPKARSESNRVKALCVGSQLAATQGDHQTAAVLLQQAQQLVGRAPSPTLQAQIAHAAGFIALASGKAAEASSCTESAMEILGPTHAGRLYTSALALCGWAFIMQGEITRAGECYRRILAVTEARGDPPLHRSTALRGLGAVTWLQGDVDAARRLLEQALRANRRTNSPLLAAFCLDALAWTVAAQGKAERAAVLMGAAEELWPAGTDVRRTYARFQDECEQTARRALGGHAFEKAIRRGQAMNSEAAVAYALGEQLTGAGPASGPAATLTKRERQVADLIAQGLSNKQIAARLVISLRTAQGHVEHILTKLAFTSRAQIAAFIVAEAEHSGSRAS